MLNGTFVNSNFGKGTNCRHLIPRNNVVSMNILCTVGMDKSNRNSIQVSVNEVNFHALLC